MYFKLEMKVGDSGGRTSLIYKVGNIFLINFCRWKCQVILQWNAKGDKLYAGGGVTPLTSSFLFLLLWCDTLLLLSILPSSPWMCTWTYPPRLTRGGRWRPVWRWCRCSVFFVAVEEEEGQDSESCGRRFSALSGQQLQHLLPLSGNHTGCYCSRQRWKNGLGGGWYRTGG